MSEFLSEKRVSIVRVGGGGLGDAGGAPVREPPAEDPDYHPEASVTGQAKGPAVPSHLPEQEILDRIEKGGRAVENVEIERWWQPNKAPPTWLEIETKIASDPRAKEVFVNMAANACRFVAINPIKYESEFNKLREDYLRLMTEDPDTYMSPFSRINQKRVDKVAEHYAGFVCYYGVPNLFGA